MHIFSFFNFKLFSNEPGSQLSCNDIAVGAVGLGFVLGPVKAETVSPTACLGCDVS